MSDYIAPYIIETPQDEITDNVFVAFCIPKERLMLMLSALHYGGFEIEQGSIGDHNIDLINALANLSSVESCNEVDLCDLIETCLTSAANGTNQSLADIINQIIQNNSSSSIDTNSTTQYDIRYDNGTKPISDVILDNGSGCDYDVLWGACLEVATRIAQMGLDILETYTASADKIQKIAAISGAIPFVGDIANSLLSAAADIAQDIENAYVAYETPSIIQDVACDIFCMVKSECRFPTFDELLDYYATGGNSSLIEILSLSYSQLYARIFNTILGNPVVWYGVQTFALATLYLDGEVLGNEGTKTIEQWSLVGSGSPSNAWETLCTDCPPVATGWCYSLDLTTFAQYDFSGAGGFQGMGVLSGTQWDVSDVSAGQGFMRGIAVSNLPAQDITINKVEIDYSATEGNTSVATLNPARFVGINNGSTQVDTQSMSIPPWGNGLTASWEFADVTLDDIRLWQNTDNLTTNNRIGAGNITALRLYGTGTNPFGADNC